jgi:peptidoglycan hydrolase-like protein with peptidoglycan-binding domain
VAVATRLRVAVAAPVLVMTTAVGGAVLTSTIAAAPAAAAAPTGASAYTPVTPTRVLDTRIGLGGARAAANGTIVVPLAGRGPVPADASAVVLNLTATGTTGPGYVTAYPDGAPRPVASNLNPERAGQTLANLVTVPVGADGAVALFTSTPTDLVVDVLGAYRPASSASAGRFVAVDPTRLLDTRAGAGAFAPGEQRRIALAGIPADAVAAVVNLTVTGVEAQPGFWTAWAAGAPRPGTSNVNVSTPGQTVPNQAIVPLSPGGFDVYSQSGGHLVVDLFGYLTGPSAPASTDGLFVPVAVPTRVLDTREATNPLGAGLKLLAGWSVEVGLDAVVPPGSAAAVVGTTTAIYGTRPGFVTAWPAGQPQPGTSNVNVVTGQIVANHTTTPVGQRGLALFSSGGTHLLFDLVGWYTGTPRPSTLPPPANPPDTSGMGPTPLRLDQGGDLGPGDYGAEVTTLQTRLEALSFWVGGVDGVYGDNTSQAVMAFQKWVGLPRTARVDLTTWEALRAASRPTARSTSGDLVEVDKTHQVLLVVRGGQVRYTINASTGTDVPYSEPNRLTGGVSTGDAHTREGRFTVYRQYSAGWESGELGDLYRPKYFSGGIAVHGHPNVPSYPASHGCVRVSMAFMDFVWAADLIPFGSAVWVYP